MRACGLLMTMMLVAGTASAQPSLGGCPVLPADNIWNTRVDQLAVHPSSATWVTTIGAASGVHADFGSGLWDGGPIGIPYVTVAGTQTKYPATFTYQSESDAGPYPFTASTPIEQGSDRHALMLNGAVATPSQCEAILKAALEACERYYQAFQFVVWAGKESREALVSTMFQTEGQA